MTIQIMSKSVIMADDDSICEANYSTKDVLATDNRQAMSFINILCILASYI